MRLRRKATVALLLVACATGAGALFIRLEPEPAPFNRDMTTTSARVDRLDLSRFAGTPPSRPLDLLFIHHSCGGQLLASPGIDEGANCIYKTHPAGGGLRALLEENNYRVHEASYASRLGDKTDIFDWPPKFRSQMDAILKCDMQDTRLPDGRRNQVVVFKSCFPNNLFEGEGAPPGNSAGGELTVWNAKAAYTALLDEFEKQPDVLFVCMTSPPLAPKVHPQPLWRVILGKLRGNTPSRAATAALARQFNNWLSSKDGWLQGYPRENVVVFDLYDLLTNCGESDLCLYPSGGGYDSHPNRDGNKKAAEAFVPFLNRATQRLNARPAFTGA